VKWFDALAQSFRCRFDELRRWGGAHVRKRGQRIRYGRVEEFPDRLEPATLYVAGEDAHPWAAAMLCPCGCGDVIELNLLKQARPCWSVQQNRDGTVTLIPSVWRTKGCRSHFFIRQSRIEWCHFDGGNSLERMGRRMYRRSRGSNGV
jgi:Family of unknown function (DUF6527)